LIALSVLESICISLVNPLVMNKNLLLFWFILLLSACGEDVVIIEETTPPTKDDELFEVNLVGFTTEKDDLYISDARITIDGMETSSDESSFFYIDKVLIGRTGKIIGFTKEGYLPAFYRIANHNSLEDVMLDLKMVKAENTQMIDASGGEIFDESARLTLAPNTFPNAVEMTFEAFTGAEVNYGNGDQLYMGDQVEYLFKEVSFYVNVSSPLSSNSNMEFSIASNSLNSNDISNLSLFHFDEIEQQWTKKNTTLTQSSGRVLAQVDALGWWTLAELIPAQYATLTLTQLNEVGIHTAETKLTFSDQSYFGNTFYTDAKGEITTYWPINTEMRATFNNWEIVSNPSAGLTAGTNSIDIEVAEDVQFSFAGLVYTCDFSFSDGFVAILSNGQHKLRPIVNGSFQSEAFVGDGEAVFQFYNQDLTFSNKRTFELSALQEGQNSFMSCTDLDEKLLVKDGITVLEDFTMCTVKKRPNETVVIAEGENGGVNDSFLLSYDGNGEGTYEGLFYYPDLLDDVQANVTINIVLDDAVSNKLAGIIRTEYISTGEELIISFIGNIE